MGKCFRSDDLNQNLLLPPSLHDWLPEKHLARFLAEIVEVLDQSKERETPLIEISWTHDIAVH